MVRAACQGNCWQTCRVSLSSITFTGEPGRPSLGQVWIATDDERIAEAVRGFGGQVVMTRSTHRSGTDRIAEAAEKIASDVVVNIQGDEPLIDFSAIDHVVQMLERDPQADMATLAAAIEDPADLWSPNVVKVVIDQRGYALLFSNSGSLYS